MFVPGRDCVAAAVLVGASVDPTVLTRVLRASGVVELSPATLVFVSVLVVTSTALVVTICVPEIDCCERDDGHFRYQ